QQPPPQATQPLSQRHCARVVEFAYENAWSKSALSQDGPPLRGSVRRLERKFFSLKRETEKSAVRGRRPGQPPAIGAMIWYSSAYGSKAPSSSTCWVPTFFETAQPFS